MEDRRYFIYSGYYGSGLTGGRTLPAYRSDIYFVCKTRIFGRDTVLKELFFFEEGGACTEFFSGLYLGRRMGGRVVVPESTLVIEHRPSTEGDERRTGLLREVDRAAFEAAAAPYLPYRAAIAEYIAALLEGHRREYQERGF